VDVDEVGLVEGGDVDLEDGDGTVAGEVDAFEVEVAGWGCGRLVVEDVHEGPYSSTLAATSKPILGRFG
jgi:hypothetical protein